MADHPKGFDSSEKQSLTEASFMQDVSEPKADSNILNLSSEQCHLQDVGSDHESVKDSEPSSNSASEYEEEDATPSFTAAAVKALLSKQGQETGEVMRGLLKEFMGKSSERPVEGRPVAKTCLPSTYTHEEIAGSSETNFTVDQCPVTDAGPYEKRQWVEGMTSYKKDLEEALAKFSPSEIQVRREKYLRSAANGMAAYLKAKEDGPLIALEVSGIAEKIRGNPNQAEEIKAGEEETLLELKNSISALNARKKLSAQHLNAGDGIGRHATMPSWQRELLRLMRSIASLPPWLLGVRLTLWSYGTSVPPPNVIR
ncbi:Hypothetical protein FKW44_008621 [Caligus rogercresseyi]|uniref:Uncharacterized protein n=1 Tax=Caligus rogercresseyi TaxID=217165 RepID=A0A7T8KGF6_CALRO|nr:Hypothetical protein FKW44_021001 [Caligus rogercresseyi]QQP55439.1 Hypothetical protein FKW44_008621 [Caligus rogercresseyi]